MRLHRQQKAFRHSDALFRGFVGGRGSGKSFAGAYDLIRRAKRDRLYLVASPTYTILSDTTFRSFKAIARDLGVLGRSRVQPPNVRLTTGAEILFRSSDDPEKLRGPNLSGAWLDEASLMVRPAYDIVIASLREQGEQGWLSATFTPKGLSHWTFELFGKSTPDTAIFHARTSQNPFLPAGFADTLRQQYGTLLGRQEIDGEFVNVAGAEFPPEYFPESIWFDAWPEVLRLKVMALDPSKGPREGATPKKPDGDYSAYVLAGLDTQGVVWLDADLARRPTPTMVADGVRLYREWQPSAFAVEINAYQELLGPEFLRAARPQGLHLPLYGIANHVNKEVRIRTLGPYLAQGKLRFRASPGGKLLVQQLRDFPCGEHDDGPDAAEMALRMVRHLLGERQQHGQPQVLRA